MGTGSANYMNLDNGIEQARHRLATLAMVERPHMIIANATEEPLKPTPHSTKKSRTLLLALTLIDVLVWVVGRQLQMSQGLRQTLFHYKMSLSVSMALP